MILLDLATDAEYNVHRSGSPPAFSTLSANGRCNQASPCAGKTRLSPGGRSSDRRRARRVVVQNALTSSFFLLQGASYGTRTDQTSSGDVNPLLYEHVALPLPTMTKAAQGIARARALLHRRAAPTALRRATSAAAASSATARVDPVQVDVTARPVSPLEQRLSDAEQLIRTRVGDEAWAGRLRDAEVDLQPRRKRIAGML